MGQVQFSEMLPELTGGAVVCEAVQELLLEGAGEYSLHGCRGCVECKMRRKNELLCTSTESKGEEECKKGGGVTSGALSLFNAVREGGFINQLHIRTLSSPRF